MRLKNTSMNIVIIDDNNTFRETLQFYISQKLNYAVANSYGHPFYSWTPSQAIYPIWF
jgi:DNA-binding NarL/FixJ family response regulator